MSNNLDVIRMNAAKAFALDMLMAGAWTLPKTLPMNTNDEQAPYGPTAQQAADRLAHALKDMDKPTERAPLLKRYSMYLDEPDMFEDMEMGDYVLYRDVWELITGGELRVNKKATRVPGAKVHTYGCSECGTEWGYYNFCPGCGSQIVKG